MNAVILGAEESLSDGVRSALESAEYAENRPIVVVASTPGDTSRSWLASIGRARREFPGAWVLAIVEAEAIGSAFAAGAHEAVTHNASAAEIDARIQRLSERVDQLATSVRGFGSPVALFDRSGNHRIVNEAYASLFGLAEQQMIGRPLSDVAMGPPACLVDRPAGSLSTFLVEVTHATEKRQLQFVCVPLSVGCLAFVLGDVIGGGMISRTGAATQARRLMTLGTLSMSLAHDFNNLLTVILGNAAFLREEQGEGETSQRMIRALESAATRAGGLTEQILRYAGGTGGHQCVDLNPLVRDVSPFLRPLTPLAELRLELADSHLEVEADVASLHQLLLNLVQNAAEASQDGSSEVVIRTGAAEVSPAIAGPPRTSKHRRWPAGGISRGGGSRARHDPGDGGSCIYALLFDARPRARARPVGRS